MLLSPPSPSNPHGNGDTEVPEEISPQRHGGWEPAYHVLRLRHGCRLAEQEPTARWERRGSHRRGEEDCSSGWSAGMLGPGVSRGHRSPGRHDSQRWGGGDWKAAWGRLCRFPPHFTPKGVRPPLAHMQESSHVFEPGQTWGHGPPPRHENGLGREQARPLEGWGPRAKALRAGVFFPHLKKK